VLRAPAATVTFDAAGGWLADDQAGTVQRFDPVTGRLLGRAVEIGGRPVAAIAGYGRVWVADTADSQVWTLDPSTGAVKGGPIAVPDGPVSMAAGDGGIWVASVVAGAVSVIDPRTDEMAGTVGLPDGAVRIAVGAGDVWVTGQTDTLTRIESRGPGSTMTWHAVRVGRAPLGVAFGDGSVWVANVQSATVARVDPATLRVTASYPVGSPGQPISPEAIALWEGRLWVSDGQQGEVVALDPDAGMQAGSPVPLPGVARQLVLDGDGGLWATTSNPGTVVHFTS
jgi:streptogramin lyase